MELHTIREEEAAHRDMRVSLEIKWPWSTEVFRISQKHCYLWTGTLLEEVLLGVCVGGWV